MSSLQYRFAAAALGAVLLACGSAPPRAASPEASAPATAPAAPAPTPPAEKTAPVASHPGALDAGTEGAKRVRGPKPTKIAARHVLIQWMGCEKAPALVVRTREQARVVAEEVLKLARDGEDFGRLVVEYSDEPNAEGRGGSLGYFGKGQMVPAFEEAAFALDVGEISNIVESPFGFHVIQRVE